MTLGGPARRGLYGISVAAELTGIEPQSLRNYEDKGLIEPCRTKGGTRRYSDYDIQRISRITTLLTAGLNLAGVAHVLELEAETRLLREEIHRLRNEAPPTTQDT
ncbi:MAG TPA: MerR family transcriptional regulator [Nocardioidaceae bacterium]|nr:MerR family transcriptional regulator [Nocardioidaceae bacterium]